MLAVGYIFDLVFGYVFGCSNSWGWSDGCLAQENDADRVRNSICNGVYNCVASLLLYTRGRRGMLTF